MIRQLTTLSLLAVVAGCAQRPPAQTAPTFDSSRNPELLSPDMYPSGSDNGTDPVVRYGRYTLVNTAPEAEQRDLMAQIIDVSIPANMHPSVQDAMQYVVNRSGYTLCPSTTDHVNILYTRPLPAAQYKLGPMTLRNTLQVLAGPAWQVKVNEVTRNVCFVLRPGYQLPETPRPAAPTWPTSTVAVATAAPAVAASGVTVSTAPPSAPLVTSPATSSAASQFEPGAPSVPTATKQPQSAGAKDGTTVSLKAGQPQVAASRTYASAVAAPATTSQRLTASPEPKPPQPPAATSQPVSLSWDAPVGSTLRKTVEEWAKRAEWRVIWSQDDLDYPIEAPLHFSGTFAEAIAAVFPLYDGARRPFTVDGNTAQRIVYVSERKKS